MAQLNLLTEEEVASTLIGAGELVYHWDLLTDQMQWSTGADALLQAEPCVLSTGQGFSTLVKADSPNTRYDAIFGSSLKDNGRGVRYTAEYLLETGDKPQLWVHDSGIWYSNEKGAPVRATGIVRIFPANSEDFKGGQLSPFDPVTGQLTTIRLMDRLENAILAAEHKGNSAAFLLASVNKLADINGSYGFAAADEVIATVGRRLAKNVRGRDTVGRYSGNKFGIVLPGCDDLEMKIAAERLMQAIESEPIPLDYGRLNVTLTLGGVIVPRYAKTARDSILCAHEALYQGRGTRSRSRFTSYSKSAATLSARQANQEIADEIVTALNDHKVHIHFQPVVYGDTEEVAFHECLLKVRLPDGKLESAQRYIEAAEKLDLIHLLDCRVLELACGALFSEPESRLSINISAKTANDPDWLMKLAALRRHYGSFNKRLIVEITETAALHDIDDAARFIKVLREMGCLVAIDDFGAGYTSFRQLGELSPDIVKIDGAFVQNLADKPQSQVFCKALMDIARAFNIKVVAEYVERQEDADILKGWNTDYLQGFLYGRAAEHIVQATAVIRKTA